MNIPNIQELWYPCAELIAGHNVPWLFIGAVLLFFGYGFLQTIIQIGKVKEIFNQAYRLVAKIEKKQSFYKDYDQITDAIHNISYISKIWREYEKTIIIPNPSTDDSIPSVEKIYITERPSRYFTVDSSLGVTRNLVQLLAFPNYLIGLGLFFTFLGLAAAIAVAQHDLTMSSQSTEGLQKLLSVASTKFLTSVTAIFCSLVLSYVQRRTIYSLKKSIHLFCDKIENLTELVSTEKLLHDSIAIQQEQKFYLTHLADNISMKFEEVLNQALPRSVAEAMTPLVETLKSLVTKEQSNSEFALKAVLEEFLKQMHQNTGDGMTQMMGSMQTLTSNLDSLVTKIEGFGGSFGQEMGTATQRMAQTMEQFVRDFSNIQSALLQFTEVMESLKIIAESIRHAGSQIQGAADGNKESSIDLGKTHGALAATVQGLSGNLEPLKDVVGQMATALEKLLSTSGNLSDAGILIKRAADEFTSSSHKLDDVHTKIGGHMDDFRLVADSMQGNVKELLNASGILVKAATPVEQLSRQMMEAVVSINRAQDVITGAFGAMSNAGDSLKQITSHIEGSWKNYESRFEKVDKDMENAFVTLARGTDDFQNKIKEFITTFDKSFSKAIQDLSGAVHQLAEEREEEIQKIRKQG